MSEYHEQFKRWHADHRRHQIAEIDKRQTKKAEGNGQDKATKKST